MNKIALYLNTFLFVVATFLIVDTFSLSGHEFIRSALASIGNISGEGTINYIARFAGAANPSNQIGNSIIYDTGTNVGIGTTNPFAKLQSEGATTAYNSDSGLISAQVSGTSKRVNIGYDTTLDVGYIQSVQSGTGNKSLLLNASGGNIGIGTTSPNAPLDVRVSVATQPSIVMRDGSDLAVADGQSMQFGEWTGAIFTENMRINSFGNVGIGETSPSAPLEIKATRPLIVFDTGGTNVWDIGKDDTSNNDFWIGDITTAVRFAIQRSTGNVGIGTTSPRGTLEVNGTMILTPRSSDPSNPVNGMMWMIQ